MLWEGATLNRERRPSVGSYTRNRLPRSSVQMSEYRPHMVRFLSRGDESRLRLLSLGTGDGPREITAPPQRTLERRMRGSSASKDDERE